MYKHYKPITNNLMALFSKTGTSRVWIHISIKINHMIKPLDTPTNTNNRRKGKTHLDLQKKIRKRRSPFYCLNQCKINRVLIMIFQRKMRHMNKKDKIQI